MAWQPFSSRSSKHSGGYISVTVAGERGSSTVVLAHSKSFGTWIWTRRMLTGELKDFQIDWIARSCQVGLRTFLCEWDTDDSWDHSLAGKRNFSICFREAMIKILHFQSPSMLLNPRLCQILHCVKWWWSFENSRGASPLLQGRSQRWKEFRRWKRRTRTLVIKVKIPNTSKVLKSWWDYLSCFGECPIAKGRWHVPIAKFLSLFFFFPDRISLNLCPLPMSGEGNNL